MAAEEKEGTTPQAFEAGRKRQEADAGRSAEEESFPFPAPRPTWVRSRSATVIGSLISVAIIGAIGVWIATTISPTPLPPPTPAPVATTPAPVVPPPAPVAPPPAPVAPPQIVVAPLSPERERALKLGNLSKRIVFMFSYAVTTWTG
jgi:hypothetical protein